MEFLKGVFVERESEKNTNLDGILKWCFCWKWNNTKTQLAKQIQIWMGFRVFVESERKDVKVILWDESESEIKSKQSKAGYYRLQLIEPVQNLWEWSKPIEIREVFVDYVWWFRMAVKMKMKEISTAMNKII